MFRMQLYAIHIITYLWKNFEDILILEYFIANSHGFEKHSVALGEKA